MRPKTRSHFFELPCLRVVALFFMGLTILGRAPTSSAQVWRDIFDLRAFDKNNLEGIHVERADELITKKQIDEMISVIGQVNRSMSPYFILPPSFILRVRLKGDMANYNTETNTLDVAYQFERVADDGQVFSKHPIYTRNILAHEYAHIVLTHNLRLRAPDYVAKRKQAYSILKEKYLEPALKILQETETQIERLQEDLSLAARSRQRDKVKILNRYLAVARQKARSLRSEVEQYMSADLFTSDPSISLDGAYAETFSDLVAVVYAKDPNAVSKALLGMGLDPNLHDSADLRDYDNEALDTQTWNVTEKHSILSPTGRYLWENYLQSPLYKHDYGKVLTIFFRAIELEIFERFADPQMHTPMELNARLQQKIRSIMPPPGSSAQQIPAE